MSNSFSEYEQLILRVLDPITNRDQNIAIETHLYHNPCRTFVCALKTVNVISD